MADNRADQYNPCQIEVLPDDVLLEIFDFFAVGDKALFSFGDLSCILLRTIKRTVEWWQPLVHVCRRWRGLVFRSPRRLNLQLYCTVPRIFTRRTLDVWPALPLIMNDDIISLLEHSNRVRQIYLNLHSGLPFLTDSEFEKVSTAMQVQFPELTTLTVKYSRSLFLFEPVPAIPDSILGGSAPRLRFLNFVGIPFPGFQKLLLFATHVVELHWIIPRSAYFSTKTMVTCLSMLTSLERLFLRFGSSQSTYYHYRERPPCAPPPTRSVLPTLVAFSFKGVNEYLEELLAWIDAPRLCRLWIEFLNEIDFDKPQLIQFIGRSLTLRPPNEAYVAFDSNGARFKFQSQAPNLEMAEIDISSFSRRPYCQLSGLARSAARIRTSFPPLLSVAENLYIYEDLDSTSILDWRDDIKNTEWLEFLFPFTGVKNLYLSKQFGPRIALFLQQLTEGRMTALLPTLQNIFLEGFQPSETVQEGIGRFISHQQLINHPITISSWDKKPEAGPVI